MDIAESPERKKDEYSVVNTEPRILGIWNTEGWGAGRRGGGSP